MKALIQSLILITSLSITLLSGICSAQKPAAVAVAGVKGNWVICGDALPKNFTYRVFRQRENGDWTPVADVKMPAAKEEIKAGLYNAQQSAGLDIIPLDDQRLQSLWERLQADVAKTSPPEIQEDLPLRSATGTAWYDTKAEKGIVYRYKVQMVARGDAGTEALTNTIKYPAEKFVTDIRPSSVKPILSGITVEFEVADRGVMTHCKVLRSYYLRTGFEEIDAEPLFINTSGKTYITFTDHSAAPKVPYTYAILPLDGAGNPGIPSPETKVFNVAENTITPSVHDFRAYSAESQKAIRLGWKLANTKNIVSIDIYKSDSYNGQYHKIAGVAAADTSYTDNNVSPITQYFYTIKLNGDYETSPASPRIPGILKASEPNPLPPLNVDLKQDGNKVILTWKRTKHSTHAYFIYRADGDGPMRQIGSPLVTDSINIKYVDVLPEQHSAGVYRYSVADENTSYVISPKSQPMYAYSEGSSTLPIPYKLTVREGRNHKLMILWADLRNTSGNFSGYRLYRRSGNTPAQPVSGRLLGKNVNVFVDSLPHPAGTYYYSLRTVGADDKSLSSPSLEAGYTFYDEQLLMLSNIKALPSGNAVQLSWNVPIGQDIKEVQVFRAAEGKEPQLLTSVAADNPSYVDTAVTAGTIYYYTFVAKNSKGATSAMTDAVGVHIR